MPCATAPRRAAYGHSRLRARTLPRMDADREQKALDAYARKCCPVCDHPLAGLTPTGSGRIRDGVFCSSECYAAWHSERLIREAQRAKDIRN